MGRTFAAFSFVLLMVACDRAGSVETESLVSYEPLASLEEWCAIYEDESVPTVTSPNPDEHVLQALDLVVARYSLLAAGAPGVSESARQGVEQIAALWTRVRDRVADGELIAYALTEMYSPELLELGETVTAELEAICS